MSTRSFEQWIDCLFDHPVTDPQWYFELDADTGLEADDVEVDYLTRLFNESDRVLRRFDDAQVNQGLWMIADPSGSNHAFAIVDDDAPWPARRAAIRAIFDLYSKCFAARCSPLRSPR